MSASSSGADSSRLPPVAAALAVAHAGLIWWLSSSSLEGVGGGGPVWGFLGNSFHFVLFGVLALLLAEAFRRDGALTSARLALVLLIVLAYGIVDEWHQASTPHRSSDPADVCIDLLGGIGCIALWWGVRGPGRLRVALLRLVAVGGVAAAFNAWRAFGPKLTG